GLAGLGTVCMANLIANRLPVRNKPGIFGVVLVMVTLLPAHPHLQHIIASATGSTEAVYNVGRFLQNKVQANDIIICVPDKDWRILTGREDCALSLMIYPQLAPRVYTLDQLAEFQTVQQFMTTEAGCQNQYIHLPHPNFEIACSPPTDTQPLPNVWLVLWRSREETIKTVRADPSPPQLVQRINATDIVFIEQRDSVASTLRQVGQIAVAESKTPLRKFENYLSLAAINLAAGDIDQALATIDEAAFVSHWPAAVSELATLQARLSLVPLPYQPAITMNVNWGNNIMLVGIDQDLTQVDLAANKVIQISSYWQTLRPVTADYKIFLHLLDQNNNPVLTFDYQPFDNQRPIAEWPINQTIRETRTLTLPDDTLPPGTYRLVTGIYEAATLENLPIVNQPNSEAWVLAEWFIDTR
ncbi:MAG: hypothetical protein R3264_11995, partial [Anaerolineae bacterium]|nr:hypothetical protein [Anaerolineae bacterium]